MFAQNPPATSQAAPAAAASSAQQAPPPAAPITAADKPNLSYAIGFQMGDGLVERKIDVDVNAVIRGMPLGRSGKVTRLKSVSVVMRPSAPWIVSPPELDNRVPVNMKTFRV